MDLPSHPGHDDMSPDSEPAPGRPVGRETWVVVAVVAALVAAMVLLHITGVVGPGAH
jgi:hypothetical protein